MKVPSSNSLSLVCNECWETVLSHLLATRSAISRITNTAKLQPPLSAIACTLCQCLSNAIVSRYPDFFQFYRDVPLSITFERDQDSEFLSLWLTVLDKQMALPSQIIHHADGIKDLNLHVSSDAACEAAKTWLRQCHDEHKLCPTSTEAPMPTRVIDVGRLDDPVLKPRLHLSRGMTAHYIALSYCWGGGQWTVTKDNVDSAMLELDVALLPQTVKDAMEITRRLGIRYLWVDALCIIQDDDHDKQYEISRMRDVYKRAYCTIIAESASNAHEGFLDSKRREAQFPCFQVPLLHADGTIGITSLRSFEDCRYRPQDARINSRGWTLQERLLAPRKLVYTQKQLRWECQSHDHMDGGFRFEGDVRKDLQSLPFYSSINQSSEAEQFSMLKYWCHLVEEYSRRQLSCTEDKLLAISALAEEFAQVWPENRYVAGIWEKDVKALLMWQSDRFDRSSPVTHCRPKRYRAPSWSWASVDGDINYSCGSAPPPVRQDSPELLTVINSDIILVSDFAPFGDVRSAQLHVCAYIREARMRYNQRLRSHDIYDLRPTSNRPHWQAWPDCDADMQHTDVWCLWVDDTPMKWIAGLLLVKDHSGYFRRIGTFSMHNSPPRRITYSQGKAWFSSDRERQRITIV